MNWKNISLFSLIAFLVQGLTGQSVQYKDTLKPHTGIDINQMLLKLEIPMGETFVRASGCQGSSVYQISLPDSFSQHLIEQREDGNGTYLCNVRLLPPQNKGTGARAGANLRMAEQLTTLNTYADPQAYIAAFCPDPDLNTDLFLDLGVGASRLNLSGLTLNNVSINSAFADVLVHYDKPNQGEMTQMTIHVANANVVLKNLEQARSRHVVVHNDMGNTKMILGEGYLKGGEIRVRSGVGGFTLVLDRNQAVELVLDTGFFSEVELPETFKKIADDTYINEAVQHSPDSRVKIYCEVDFGKIVVIER